MKTFPTKALILIGLLLIFFFQISCQKDSDLFYEAVLNDSEKIVEEQSGNGNESTETNTDSNTEESIEHTDGSIVLNTLKAFPSAQGHGTNTVTGGKGGKIFYVDDLGNNTNGSFDSSTGTHRGSFKYALQHPDPGYIIFRTSGVILASSVNDYLINNSNAGNKTILGGTAPFPGIVFYGHQFRVSYGKGNWVFRGITFLGGDDLEPGKYDSFFVLDVDGLILSDNTFGWHSDEACSVDDSDKITIQRNFMIEGHPDHNTGSLFHTDTQTPGARAMSMHNNGYVHISHRFPNIAGLETDYIDAVNQSIYNWKSQIQSHLLQAKINDINNYYKSGPRTSSSPSMKRWSASSYGSSLWAPIIKIFTSGNIVTGILEDSTADNSVLWSQHRTQKGYEAGDALPKDFFADSMHPLGLDIRLKTASETYSFNINGKNIGSRYYMDSNGKRQKYILPFIDDYFDDAINGTDLAFRDNPNQFTLPSVPSSETPYDVSDFDGMADEWEILHGLTVGVDDKEGVKPIWVIDGIEVINNAGFTNIQMFDDYVHGGFIALKNQ